MLLGKLSSVSEDNVMKRIKYHAKILQVVTSLMQRLKHKAVLSQWVSAVGEGGTNVFPLLLAIVPRINTFDLFGSAAREWLFVLEMKMSSCFTCLGSEV